nr:ABC transporter [uncultured bacterium]
MTALEQNSTQNVSVIDIRLLSTAYGKVKVLHDIEFSVPAGICCGLIGLNGAGKTTLIKVLLGLRDATSGTASILGYAPGHAEAKAQIAYLPEKFDPPPFLTGYEFIRFTQKLYGRSISQDAILEAASLLQLQAEALPRRVTSYSKGMRQKLGLMAALLTDCQLVILDEPMSGLDPRARSLVKEAILTFQKRGRTVIICSHILADLDEICAQIAVIHEGYLAYNGSPEGLKEQTGQNNLERAFLSCIDQRQAA